MYVGRVSPHCSGGCSWLYAVLPRVASWRVVVACSAVCRAASEKAKRAGPSLSTADRWSAPTRASTPSVRNSTAQRTHLRVSPAFSQVLGRVQSRRGRRSGSGELSDAAEMWQRRPKPKRAAPLLPILRATPRHATPRHSGLTGRCEALALRANKQTNKQTNKPAPRRAPPSAVVNYCARVGSARRHALHVAKAGRSVYVCVRTCARVRECVCVSTCACVRGCACLRA